MWAASSSACEVPVYLAGPSTAAASRPVGARTFVSCVRSSEASYCPATAIVARTRARTRLMTWLPRPSTSTVPAARSSGRRCAACSSVRSSRLYDSKMPFGRSPSTPGVVAPALSLGASAATAGTSCAAPHSTSSCRPCLTRRVGESAFSEFSTDSSVRQRSAPRPYATHQTTRSAAPAAGRDSTMLPAVAASRTVGSRGRLGGTRR